MLTATPEKFYSWNYSVSNVSDLSKVLGTLEFVKFRESGGITVGESKYLIEKIKFLPAAWELKLNSALYGRVWQPLFFLRRFEIEFGHKKYTLKALGPLLRSFRLWESGELTATIRCDPRRSRQPILECHRPIDGSLQFLVIWLVVLNWRRTAIPSNRWQ